MEKKRLERLTRIMKMQQQRETAVKFDLSVVDTSIEELKQSSTDLSSQWGLHDGALGEIMNRTVDQKIRRNAREQARLEKRKGELMEELMNRQRESKMTEKEQKRVGVAYGRKQETERLFEVLEGVVSQKRSGPDKSR
ncbi:hypothetical protein E1162_05865 [Rhodobacteraceae bacterium RKSG542]|uniref:hypothetical protein n=1 Tax=Pseudovibrio flavus TaxID=2529854 RepID=UPI0012BBC70B|nr:hypothetical protein [Pseudovibrio flavus]MTI16759.1 hypothetical protein [Pseudovibrio flavus]